MEPPSGIGAWGPPPTQALIDAVAKAGFNAVRIPCAWDSHADPSTHQIDPVYLARVKQVVDWCYARNLYVVVNDHWDGGWLENNITDTVNPTINAKMKAYWTQIATAFAGYDSHLLFAGANEPNCDTAAQWKTLQTYYTTFIAAVRSTGGDNTNRWLVIQGPNTNIDQTDSLVQALPADPTPGRLMVEVHFYAPYQFTLMTSDATWGKMWYFWGAAYHSATLADRNATQDEESYVDAEFQKMTDKFVSKGIPVMIGEFEAMKRTTAAYPDLTGANVHLHLASRTYFDQYIVDSAHRHGLSPFYWDTPGGAQLFDWNTGAVSDADSVRALTGGAALSPTQDSGSGSSAGGNGSGGSLPSGSGGSSGTSQSGGTGSPGSTAGAGGAAQFLQPVSLTEDSAGNLYVADAANDVIKKISVSGVVSTLAGSAGVAGLADGTGSAALFNLPHGVAVDGAGNVYVADTGNGVIRKITPAGEVTTLAGAAANRGNQDGTGTAAQFNQPMAVAVGSAGDVYVADASTDTIRQVTPAGVVTTVAGSANTFGDADGAGTAARFNHPSGIAVDASGDVYVADTYNDTIRKITPAGGVTTLAGSAGVSGSNDGAGGYALFDRPEGLAVDGVGNVFVADTGNGMIREVTPAGAVTTVAGRAGVAALNDAVGTNALFNQPQGVAVVASGVLYVADTGNAVIRRIATDGTVTTMALTAAVSSSGSASDSAGSPASGPVTTSGGGGSGGGGLGGGFVAALLLLGMARWPSLARRDLPGRSTVHEA